MEFVIDARELVQFADAMAQSPEVLNTELEASAYVVLHEGIGYAQEFVPRDEGNLAASIVILEEASASGGSYGSELDYAWQREEGGTIYPRNGQFLVFEVGGQLVFARKVTQEGSHYMQQSMDAMEPRVVPIYQLAIDRTLGVI